MWVGITTQQNARNDTTLSPGKVIKISVKIQEDIVGKQTAVKC